jgi:hypothetical protein
VTNDIETLITALYVTIEDELGGPRWVGRPPVLTDSELVCLAAAQALLGFTSEAHWLRYARIDGDAGYSGDREEWHEQITENRSPRMRSPVHRNPPRAAPRRRRPGPGGPGGW